MCILVKATTSMDTKTIYTLINKKYIHTYIHTYIHK